MRFVNSKGIGGASEIGFSETMSDRRTPPGSTSIRSGRPNREQARIRQEALLDSALRHFLEKGFEQTTIDAIAADVSMTKRTIYSRYPEKSALFRAALTRGAMRYAVTPERIASTRVPDIAATLINIAKLRIELNRTEEGMMLLRMVNTEAYRFPDIFNLYYEISVLPTVRFLAEILEEETRTGRLAVTEPLKAANVFMSMVVSGPVRFITSGNPLPDEELDERIAFAVDLFLQGARSR